MLFKKTLPTDLCKKTHFTENENKEAQIEDDPLKSPKRMNSSNTFLSGMKSVFNLIKYYCA